MSKMRAILGEEPMHWPEPNEPLTLEGFLLKCKVFSIPLTHPMRVFSPSTGACAKVEGARRTERGIELQPGAESICRPILLEQAYGIYGAREDEKLIGPTGKEVFLLGWGKDDMVLEELP